MSKARNVTKFAERVAESLVAVSHKLVSAGARHIAFPTLTPADKSPYGVHQLDDKSRATMANFTRAFNERISREARNATVVDVHSIANKVFAHPERHGIRVVGDAPCLVCALKHEKERHVCAHPDAYAYWDLYHPTAHMHKLIANGAINAFK